MRGLWVLGLLIFSCGGGADEADDGTTDDQSSGDVGSTDDGATSGAGGRNAPAPSGVEIIKVDFELDYASGAEPYESGGLSNRDPFELGEANLARLFRDKELILPHSLGSMEELTDVPSGPYSSETILALADEHRDHEGSSDDTASYYVIWLDGYFFDSETNSENRNVLGVSLGGTSVMALFKPVIRTAEGGLLANKAAYVEQTTLIHELGHAAGLVNNGFVMVRQHQDEEHGAHCDNPDCIMYYLNEGVDSLSQFVRIIGDDESPVLFDADCLADVDAANAQ